MPNCGGNAVVQLVLEDFRLIYGCDRHEDKSRHQYPDASIIKLR
jgi:hypothetical protein